MPFTVKIWRETVIRVDTYTRLTTHSSEVGINNSGTNVETSFGPRPCDLYTSTSLFVLELVLDLKPDTAIVCSDFLANIEVFYFIWVSLIIRLAILWLLAIIIIILMLISRAAIPFSLYFFHCAAFILAVCLCSIAFFDVGINFYIIIFVDQVSLV